MFSRGQATHPPKAGTKGAEPLWRGSGSPQAEEKNPSGGWAGNIAYQDLRNQAIDPTTRRPGPGPSPRPAQGLEVPRRSRRNPPWPFPDWYCCRSNDEGIFDDNSRISCQVLLVAGNLCPRRGCVGKPAVVPDVEHWPDEPDWPSFISFLVS